MGRITWTPEGDSWPVLLPLGFTADDIAVEYRIPEAVEKDGGQQAIIALYPAIADARLPSFFYEMIIPADVELYEPAVPVVVEPSPGRQPFYAGWPIFNWSLPTGWQELESPGNAIFLGILVAVAILLLQGFIRLILRHRRARRRMQRLLRRERHARFR